ncbi:TetR/AcrR family transcriptional regulator [Pannus brasiliensis CCIBt3594]|uniref:TetR/AcrR family transcriptional regulator n=1 Tax=Pannus brasiliensis CCIBt3594 TaxID=1427578 RepID=A0AAW9QWT9_9CHRO
MPNLTPSPETDLAPPTGTPRQNSKREAILQGAMRVFSRSGYAGTSMDRVAAEAGVSKQTIYSHFQDKEGLFTAMMERVTIGRFQSVLTMDSQQGEPAILLERFATEFLEKIVDEEYVGFLRLIIAESMKFPELAKLYGRTVVQRGRELMADFFRKHPEFGFADEEAVAHIFIGSLVSYVLAQEIFYGKESFPLARDRLVKSLLGLLLSE